MRLDELHAWISVDGVELPEFAVEYSADGKEASCWIPSECDKVERPFPLYFVLLIISSNSQLNSKIPAHRRGRPMPK
jgi:hypothetical protein